MLRAFAIAFASHSPVSRNLGALRGLAHRVRDEQAPRLTRAMGDAARDRMMAEVEVGGTEGGDASDKVILVRGCDPIMAQRAGVMLHPSSATSR